MKQRLRAASIIREDVEKASAFSKRLVMNDGTEREIYSLKPMHYFDNKTNKWEEIDNSLEETDDGYIAKLGNYKVKLSKEEDNERVEVFSEDMSKSISWKYIGTENPNNPTKQRIGKVEAPKHRKGIFVEKDMPGLLGVGKRGRLVYEGVKGDVDIEYDIANGSLKENIIVKKKRKSYKYYFELKLKGLDIQLSENGKSIEFIDCNADNSNGTELEPEFIMPAPIMFDATGSSSEDLYYEIEKNGEDYVFSICASSNWINAKNRTFPIKIDPQLSYVESNQIDTSTKFNTKYYWTSYGEDECGNPVTDSGSASGSSFASVGWNETSSDWFQVIISPTAIKEKPLSYKKRKIGTYLTFDAKCTGTATLNVGGTRFDLNSGKQNISCNITEKVSNLTNNLYIGISVDTYNNYVEISNFKIEVVYFNISFNKDKTKMFDLLDHAKCKIDLLSGSVDTVIEDIKDNTIGVSLAHIYKQSNESYNCGKNFRLNINDSLEKNGTSYIYTDSFGNVHTFDERYFFINENGEKEIVTDLDALRVDVDGVIWYNEEQVYRELYTDDGIRASAKLENIAGVEWLEQRLDEEKQLAEQISALENAIKSYVAFDKSKNEIEKRIAKIDKVEEFINCNYPLVYPESDAIMLKSIYDQHSSLEIEKKRYEFEIGKIDVNINAGTTAAAELTTYIDGLRNELLSNHNNEKQAELDEKVAELEKCNQDINKFSEQKGIIEAQIKELENSINTNNLQIKYYESLTITHKNDLERYYKEYLNLKNQLEKLQMDTPVCYLITDNYVKGYNADGDLVMIRNNSGSCIYVEREKYTSSGKTRIVALRDDEDHMVSFEYNNVDLLKSITDSVGRKTSYEYSNGELKSIEFYNGKKLGITYSYHTNSNIQKAIESISDKTKSINVKFDYSTTENKILSIIKNAVNGTTEVELDRITIKNTSDGVNVIYSDGKTEKYVIDIENVRISEYYELVNDKVSHAEKYDYINDYLKSCIYYADEKELNKSDYAGFEFDSVIGYKEELEYNSFELVTTKTVGWKKVHVDSNNTLVERQSVTKYVYNADNKLIETNTTVNERIGNVSKCKCVIVSKMFYNSVGNVVREESYVQGEELISGIAVTEYVYDDIGCCIKQFTYNTLDPSTKFYVEKQYDENGILLATVDETGRAKTVYEYDSTGNLLSEILPNGSRYSYGRNKSGEVCSITHSTEFGESNSTEKSFTNGLLTKIKSGNNKIEYSYNSKRKISKIDLNDYKDYVSYLYSKSSIYDKTEATMANGVIITETKDKRGNVLSVETNAAGNKKTVTNTYNNRNRITTVADSVSGNTSYTYNEETGVIQKVESADGVTELYTYNDEGKHCEKSVVSENKARTYSYIYDNETVAEPIKSLCVDGITVTTELDVNGRNICKTISVPGSKEPIKIAEEQIAYLKFGDRATNLPSTVRYGNNVNDKYDVCDSVKYRYDTMGNIVEVLENGLSTAKYEYDALGRLKREDNKHFAKTTLFSYDDNGNIIAKYEYAFTNVETDALNTIEPTNTILYSYDEDSDRVLVIDDRSKETVDIFVYDETIGNPTTYRGKSVTWSHGREMTGFDGNTFTYDARGRRVSKNDITFTYDSNGKLIKQSNGLEFIYDNTGLLAVEYNGLRYFYRKNAQNDIIALLDNDGNIVVKYVYDAWGNQKIVDCNGNEVVGTNHIGKLNPFRYRSYYYDIETNLYFLKTRYYDPEICRFITIDDISYLAPDTINGLNLYAYCLNNPIGFLDINGTNPLVIVGITENNKWIKLYFLIIKIKHMMFVMEKCIMIL